MKNILLIVFVLINAGAAAFAAPGGKYIETGKPAPGFKLQDQNKNAVELKDFKGKILVIVHTSARRGADSIVAIANETAAEFNPPGADKKGSGKVSVFAAGNFKKLPSFLRNRVRKSLVKPGYPAFLMDWKGELAAAFGQHADGNSVYIIGPDGRVEYAGDIENTAKDKKKLIEIITALLEK